MNLYNIVFKSFGKLNKPFFIYFSRHLSQTPNLCSFFENDSRGGDYPLVLQTPWQELLKQSWKAFPIECKKFAQETKDHFQQDRKYYRHGDTDVFWRFDSEDCLKDWRVSSDKFNKDGQSECHFMINDKKKAVFYGNLDLTVPKDGKNRFAGYCGIKSGKKMKSFFREDWYEFSHFTHLELRVRGDGRNYAINLGTGLYYDVTWFTMFTYAIYTHGGPYWQLIRIPFSKFFMQSKGRVQDRQCPVPLDRINCIGITCAGVSGPFRLEIDYIGCHVDWRHTEKHAYEMYEIPKEFVSN